MQLPTDGTKVNDLPLAFIWLDKDGIINCITKNTLRTSKLAEDHFEFIRKLLNNEKALYMVDDTNTGPIETDCREFIHNVAEFYLKAVAIITKSVQGRMSGEIVRDAISTTVPTAIFSNPTDARDWLLNMKNTLS